MQHPLTSDTAAVRLGEELPYKELELFLRSKLEHLPADILEVQQFPAGHSNLTYQLKMGKWEAVLRRPPHGPVAPKAHDMQREYKIISNLQPLFSPAPKPILFSNDQSIIGSPFFLMERKRGLVIDGTFPKGIEPTAEMNRRISEIMVSKLVELHAIPFQQTSLLEITKPEGFMERQVHGWIRRYERVKTDENPAVVPLAKWLTANIPKRHEFAVIHYDYKLNNMMFNEDFTSMEGLFDWEMATIGDPLADLGVALGYWIGKSDPTIIQNGPGRSVTMLDGFLDRSEFINLYARKSGRDVTHINFYLAFAFFKLAGICQQIFYRYKLGQTDDPRFASLNEYVNSLMIHGLSIIEGEL